MKGRKTISRNKAKPQASKNLRVSFSEKGNVNASTKL